LARGGRIRKLDYFRVRDDPSTLWGVANGFALTSQLRRGRQGWIPGSPIKAFEDKLCPE